MTTRRWLWAGLVTGIVTLFLLDQGLKTSLESGFAPAGTSWQAATADFPRFWGELEASGPYAVLTGQIPRPMQPLELAVYERTGVRPTAMRWAVWLGRHAVASGNAEHWGICVRPGALLHAMHGLRRLAGVQPDAHGVYRFEDLHYGWRRGFLVVSASAEFVTNSLDPQRSEPVEPAPSNALRLRWQPPDAPPLEILLRARGEWRMAMQIEGGFSESGTRMQAPLADWPESPLVSLGAARVAHLAELRRAVRVWIAASPIGPRGILGVDELWQRWDLPPLAPDWPQDIAATAFAFDLAYRGAFLPEPSAAAHFYGAVGVEGPHPLAPWLDALDPIPFEWDGVSGGCATLLGDSIALCLAGAGSPWLTASNEPLMARIAGHGGSPDWVDADAVVTLDWRRAATLLRQGLLVAARNEWLPGHDMATLEADWGHWLDALSAMGQARLAGHAENGSLRLEGALTTTAAGGSPW